MTKLSRPLFPLAIVLVLSVAVLSTGGSAKTRDAASPAVETSATRLQLAESVRIPYETFTLDNGLRVLVHTDRKAPVVAVSVWYDIGSKHEPKGKTGFAHLFEHLMFNGSENADYDFFKPMQEVGATGMNGTTWYDRTNYFQTVPTGALEKTLYLESDRMGHLLGAVTQEKLDNQRGVVQNEKRQGDNKPYGLVGDAQTKALFPSDHPYGHDTIGSMEDLDAASLEDVRNWFRQHYGPNNAILSLAGDIDLPTARRLVDKYFGRIPKGPATQPVAAPLPTLPARKDEMLQDRVATTRLYRTWVIPGLNEPDAIYLDMGAAILGGLASSRLDNMLVKGEQLMVSASASVQVFAQMGQFEITADIKPGVDPVQAGKRLDAVIGELVDKGPSAEELNRAVTGNVAGAIQAMESVSTKASILAEGLLYSNDPARYAKELRLYATATPTQVQAAMQKWLSRPVYALTVTPGARPAYTEAAAKTAAAPQAATETLAIAKRDPAPPVGMLPPLRFPEITHSKLSNGIEVVYAQRSAVPTTLVSLSFDAGTSADPAQAQGTAALMGALLKEGTLSLDSIALAERQEALGASIGAGSSLESTGLQLSALSANLGASLDLFADIALNPAFNEVEIERVRAQMLSAIDAELTSPQAMAARVLNPALYGSNHPYARQARGTTESVKVLTRGDLVAFHHAWMRPEGAKFFVVSDKPLSEIQPMLEARFARWVATGSAGIKNLDAPIPAPTARILLIDRKDSPQSHIAAGMVLDRKGTDDLLDLEAAAQIVGGSFLSRINMDLRETKGWSYGVRAGLSQPRGPVAYKISAPVQADKTGPAIAALLEQYQEFLTSKGVTDEELARTQDGNVRELPGSFQTGGAVLSAMQENSNFDRPDDYYVKLAPRIRAQTAEALDKAARSNLDMSRLVWVVVGDADKIRPQLAGLGLPVEEVSLK